MTSTKASESGLSMHAKLQALYPICRSITGNGVRETLKQLQTGFPLKIYEVPSGTQVFDWLVPKEWNIRDAWVKNSAGERIVDFRRHNLHVVSYSVPINQTMPLEELKKHLYSLPEQPEAIPHRATYYKEDWGFCLSHNTLQSLVDGDYEVHIDSTLETGSLTYGEYFHAGQSSDEVLFSAHICHPSLANDNLSGIVVAAALAMELSKMTNLRYSYRFVFAPATIGAITWLAQNKNQTQSIKHGLILSGLGDRGAITYKQSRLATAEIDRAVQHVLKNSGESHAIQSFSPYGYDERQYCSPGFNLAIGCFSRTPHGTYPEYHTSNDNPDFVRPESLEGSLKVLLSVVQVLEGNCRYVNTNPYCEPQLGKRGLFKEFSSTSDTMAMLWVLNLADGQNSLLDIAESASLSFDAVQKVAAILESHGLLSRVHAPSR